MNISRLSTWHPMPSSASFRICYWLKNRGSLTHLIKQHCKDFHVKLVSQSLATVYKDELAVMGLRRGELALVREVHLYCGETPVVFAHSIIVKKDLRGAWRKLNGLGNRSLGATLFNDPMVRRTSIRFKKINSSHPLFNRACTNLQTMPLSLWARRSLFSLHGQSILVTEIFLPPILDFS
ncbi:MAG: chorismate lyase [Nitrosospira sp.]|nr:chorismate lyase [Nitrosospira sp.]